MEYLKRQRNTLYRHGVFKYIEKYNLQTWSISRDRELYYTDMEYLKRQRNILYRHGVFKEIEKYIIQTWGI